MIIEASIIFAFLAMICWGLGDFLIQRCTRKIGDVECLAFIGIIGAVMVFPFAYHEFNLLFSLQNIILVVAFSIITFISAILDFEALKKGKLSIVDVVIEIELPVTILLGIFLFGETLSLSQIGIISLIFIGIILIATKSFSHWKTRLEKGVFLAFLAAVTMGIVNFSMAYSGRVISPLITIWSIWVITGIFSLILIWWKRDIKKSFKDGIKFKWLVLAMGVFDTLAWLFYVFAVNKAEISITTSITEAYPAIALFLGLWLNKEEIGWHQYLGAGVALAASFVLGFLI